MNKTRHTIPPFCPSARRLHRPASCIVAMGVLVLVVALTSACGYKRVDASEAPRTGRSQPMAAKASPVEVPASKGDSDPPGLPGTPNGNGDSKPNALALFTRQVGATCDMFIRERDEKGVNHTYKLKWAFAFQWRRGGKPVTHGDPALMASAESKLKAAVDRYNPSDPQGPRQPDPNETPGSLWLRRHDAVEAFLGMQVERENWGDFKPNEPDYKGPTNEFYETCSNGIARAAFARASRLRHPIDERRSPSFLEQAEMMIDAMIEDEQTEGAAAYAVADELSEVVATGGEGIYTQTQATNASRFASIAVTEGDGPLGQVQLPDKGGEPEWPDGGVGVDNVGSEYPDHDIAEVGKAEYESIP